MKLGSKQISVADEYRDRLRIDQNDLDKEVAQQPFIFMEVSERHVLAISRRDQLKDAMDMAAASLTLKLRNSEDKYTVAEIAATVATSPVCMKARSAYMAAADIVQQLYVVKESFAQRGYMLRELCNLYSAGYWGQSSVKGANTADRTVDHVRRSLTKK